MRTQGRLMWMLGAVLGVMALAVVVGGVWTWHASGRRTREDRADVVLRPRMERVSGGDAAQSPRPTAPRAESSQAEPSQAKVDLPSSPGPAREVPAPPSARGVQQRHGAESTPLGAWRPTAHPLLPFYFLKSFHFERGVSFALRP